MPRGKNSIISYNVFRGLIRVVGIISERAIVFHLYTLYISKVGFSYDMGVRLKFSNLISVQVAVGTHVGSNT